jgi:hypothetical protein
VHLAPEAVMVFAAPVGVLDREGTLASLEHAPRWRQVEIREGRLLRLSEDGVVFVYRAEARREGQKEPYVALCSSSYSRQAGDWKLVAHQQSPG